MATSKNTSNIQLEKLKIIIIGNKCVGKTCLAHRFVNNTFLAKHTPTILADFFKVELPVKAFAPEDSSTRPAFPLSQSASSVPSSSSRTTTDAPLFADDAVFGNPSTSGANSKDKSKKQQQNTSNEYLPSPEKRVLVYIWDTAGQESYHEHDAIIAAYYRNADAALLVFKLTDYESFLALSRWRTRLLAKVGVDSLNSERFPIVVVGNFLDLADSQRQVPTQQAKRWCQMFGEMPFFEASSLTGARVHEAFHTVIRQALEYRRRVGKPPDLEPLAAPAEGASSPGKGCC